MTKNKMIFSLGILMSFILFMTDCASSYKQESTKEQSSKRKKSIQEIPINSITSLELLPEIYEKMQLSTWPKGCPVPIEGLAYIKVVYWGFDEKSHEGALIVNKELAKEVLEIFLQLYGARFPIQQMRPIHEFNNDDDLSMEANNTSAFNCRAVTGQPGMFSQHAYGRAIDINPFINPYVKGAIVLPKGSEKYVNATEENTPGKITARTLPYSLFKGRGWDWGGEWLNLQDQQHFEKRANGKKRNPHGDYSQVAPSSPGLVP